MSIIFMLIKIVACVVLSVYLFAHFFKHGDLLTNILSYPLLTSSMKHCWADPSPSVGVGKLQLGFERLDLLLLDDMVKDLPVGQMGIGLSSILKQLPQCHPKSPEHRTISTDECFSMSSGVTTPQKHVPTRKLLFSSKNDQQLLTSYRKPYKIFTFF